MYRAYKYVKQGIANTHAYNLFLSFEEICHRLGLWPHSIGWWSCSTGFKRLTKNMPTRATQATRRRGAATSREPI